MLNEFWQTSGPAYRIIVFSAMGLIAIGLVLTIIGGSSGNNGVMWVGMPFLGLGVALNLVGMVVRGQGVRRRLREAAKKP